MSHRGPSLQPPDSQEALASLRSLSPGRPAVPHTNRGEGAVGIRKAKVSTANSRGWAPAPTRSMLRISVMGSASPKSSVLSRRLRPTTTTKRMSGNCCHLVQATVFSLPHMSQEHKPGRPEEGGKRLRGLRSPTVRSRAAQAQLSPGNKPAGQHTASWTQPGSGLSAGSEGSRPAAKAQPCPFPSA